MLTLLEPPSPASSARLREVERSFQTTPQLLGALPMASPPGSYPEKHHDTAESSRVPPVFKRLQTIFKKTKKDQASQLPNQLSTKSGRPVDFRLASQLQPPADITKGGPSRFAAGKRVRVSVFFFGRHRYVACLTKHLSEWSQNPLIWFVVQFGRWCHCLSCVTAQERYQGCQSESSDQGCVQ